MLTNRPLAAPCPCCCRLLASVVRNCCSSVFVSLVELLDDPPMAVNRFWKSEVSSLSVLLPLDVLLVVLESEDVLLEDDVSDCARFEIADARSLP
ncbi:hypothetical protein C7401_104279 [Paraburkholderia unamae]|nr:hypothetical protein C7401_104279 [Paraburkholderia unamae]